MVARETVMNTTLTRRQVDDACPLTIHSRARRGRGLAVPVAAGLLAAVAWALTGGWLL